MQNSATLRYYSCFELFLLLYRELNIYLENSLKRQESIEQIKDLWGDAGVSKSHFYFIGSHLEDSYVYAMLG